MFKELLPVLQNRALTITVASVAGGKIRVCVVPKSLDADSKVNEKVGHNKEVAKIPEEAIKALTTPLAITDTAEELDATLGAILTKYATSHVELQHGIDQATREITDALKAIEERNKSKSKPKADTAGKKAAGDGKEAKSEQPLAQDTTLPLSWCAPPQSPAVTAVSAADANITSEIAGGDR
jgi:PRTRC genetic system protein E